MKLQNIKPTRRAFLSGTGAVGFALLASGGVTLFGGCAEAQAANETDINGWIVIHADGSILIRFGAAEMGQGVNTSLPMIVAEELDADWSRVSVEQVSADPDGIFGNPSFGGMLFSAGSSSIEGYFTTLRLAGANARRVLIHTAAAQWGVASESLTTDAGYVVKADGERLGYGDVIRLPAPLVAIDQVSEADLKPRADWRIIGRDQDRLDIPGKTRGESIYSIDVRLPGMLYAAQLLAPVEGEIPNVLSDQASRQMARSTRLSTRQFTSITPRWNL